MSIEEPVTIEEAVEHAMQKAVFFILTLQNSLATANGIDEQAKETELYKVNLRYTRDKVAKMIFKMKSGLTVVKPNTTSFETGREG